MLIFFDILFAITIAGDHTHSESVRDGVMAPGFSLHANLAFEDLADDGRRAFANCLISSRKLARLREQTVTITPAMCR